MFEENFAKEYNQSPYKLNIDPKVLSKRVKECAIFVII